MSLNEYNVAWSVKITYPYLDSAAFYNLSARAPASRTHPPHGTLTEYTSPLKPSDICKFTVNIVYAGFSRYISSLEFIRLEVLH